MKDLLNRKIQTTVKSLADKVIVITRSIEDANESAEKFSILGAKVISFPTIEVLPPDDWKEFDNNIKKLIDFDLLVFTSANAVRMFVKRCAEINIMLDFSNIKTAAVGKKTSDECKKYNINVDVVPKEFNAKSLFEELSKYKLNDIRIFIPGSAIAREELQVLLKEKGAVVIAAPVYKLGIPTEDLLTEKIKELENTKPDLFIFTSPSTFRNFLQILKITEPAEYFSLADIAVIGPTTRTEIENSGLSVNIMPDEYTLDGLLESVINYYKLNEN